MRRSILDVRIGDIILDHDGQRQPVVDRSMWSPCNGGRPWVRLSLRTSDGEVVVREFLVTEVVNLDPFRAGIHGDDAGREAAIITLQLVGASVVRDEGQAGRPVYEVDLGRSGATDEDVRSLSSLPEVVNLHLDLTAITDVTLRLVCAMRNLELLNLEGTVVTDAGLAYLHDASLLRSLNLDGTSVTDAGLSALHGLRQLEWLAVAGTAVTSAGIRHLRGAVPSLQVVVDTLVP